MYSDINTAHVEKVLHAVYPTPRTMTVWCDDETTVAKTPAAVRKFLDSTGDVARAHIQISLTTHLYIDDNVLRVVSTNPVGVIHWEAEFTYAPVGLVVGAINTALQGS